MSILMGIEGIITNPTHKPAPFLLSLLMDEMKYSPYCTFLQFLSCLLVQFAFCLIYSLDITVSCLICTLSTLNCVSFGICPFCILPHLNVVTFSVCYHCLMSHLLFVTFSLSSFCILSYLHFVLLAFWCICILSVLHLVQFAFLFFIVKLLSYAHVLKKCHGPKHQYKSIKLSG